MAKTKKKHIEIAALNGSPVYAAAGGTANAITCTLDPAPASWNDVGKILLKIASDNTGAVTVSPNSLAARTIKKIDGTTDLVAGDLKQNMIIELWNDGTNLQMLSPVANVTKNRYTYIRASNVSTTSTALVDVSGMSFSAAEANKKYIVTVSAWIWNSGSASVTLRLTTPTGSTINGVSMLSYINPTEIIINRIDNAYQYTNLQTSMNVAVLAHWDVLVIVGGTAGNIKLQFSSADYTSYVGSCSKMTVEETL